MKEVSETSLHPYPAVPQWINAKVCAAHGFDSYGALEQLFRRETRGIHEILHASPNGWTHCQQ